MLYEPAHHEPLTERPWVDAWVRDAIAAVVRDTDDAYGDLWPATESDAFGAAALPLKELYVGAAGIVWGLAELRPHAESSLDLPSLATGVLARYRAEPDTLTGIELPAEYRSSLLSGETGIAYVAWKLAREGEEELAALIDANRTNPANELMWGVPGTLLAARALGRADLVRRSEDALRAARDADGLWTQRLYGDEVRYLGPAHGLVGCVAALGEPGNAADVLRASVLRVGAHANWPPLVPLRGGMRLQWCHGAPGIVTTAASYLDADLLVAGAQLTWDAGPLESNEKGAGLCHGTAGNGYALLRAFERTGDELWLARARAFAVHALEQARRLPPRHALFTGGLGAALYAADCLDEVARFPFVDRF